MATINYRICDRCGEKIERKSPKLLSVQKIIKWRIVMNIKGITHASREEFCGKCSEQLEAFMYNKADVVMKEE